VSAKGKCADCAVCADGSAVPVVGRTRSVGRRLWLTIVVGRCSGCGHRTHRESVGLKGYDGVGAGYALGAVNAAVGGGPGSNVSRLAHLDHLKAQGSLTEDEYRIARTAIISELS
jgi:hypothetical protein